MVFSKLKEKKAPQNNCGREREKARGKSGSEEDETEDKEEDGGEKTDEEGVEEDEESEESMKKQSPKKRGKREKAAYRKEKRGKEKEKGGKAGKEKKRINEDPENKEREKEKKRRGEGEEDKEEAQDDSNKDEGLCVGCKQPPNTTDRCASKECTNFVHKFCGYGAEGKKTCPGCRYVLLFSHLILPEELGFLQIRSLRPRSPRKGTSLLLFLLLCPQTFGKSTWLPFGSAQEQILAAI
jgi:hypothetical protein